MLLVQASRLGYLLLGLGYSASNSVATMSQGACIALDVGKWSELATEICNFHGVPSPLPDESLPVGTGSNPVSSMISTLG